MDPVIQVIAVLVLLLALGAAATSVGADSRHGIGDQHAPQR